MSLRIILGRAGTGKTRRCLDEIAAELRADPLGAPLVFLVPEQATFQMEQALVASAGGFARVRITGFRRFAAALLREARGMGRPHLSEVGRRMLIRSLLHRRRHELQLFTAGGVSAGLVERIESSLREFRSHGFDPDHLASMARAMEDQRGQSLLAAKLRDLAVLYDDFCRTVEPEYADPDQTLTDASRCFGEIPWLAGSEVWVDGFAGFTPAEMHFLTALLTAVRRVTVALCLDPRRIDSERPLPSDEAGFFRQPAETYAELKEAARRVGVAVEPDVRLHPPRPPRFQNAALARLERSWDDASSLRREGAPSPEGVTVCAARNRTDEVEAAALEILRLCREDGYRFREISVVVRDLDVYAETVEAIFSEWQIPYFIDRRRPVAHHPLARLLTAALDVVRSRWETEAVIRFLKSDLLPLERDEVDLLENEALRFGYSGREWWIPEPKVEALRPLVELEQALAAPGLTRRQAAECLWKFLVRLGVRERIARWITEAESAQDATAASVHRQAWEGVVTLLDELGGVASDVSVDVSTLAAMVDEGIATLYLGLIPPNLDQVLVGAIDRSRQPDVRAVFILGAVDREFPRVPQEDAVLSDTDRERLAAAGYRLAPTSRHRLQQERFLAYIAVTRASERLWVSYPKADARGKALFPSSLVERVRRLLPGVRVIDTGDAEPGHRMPPTARRLAADLSRALRSRPDAPEWLDVYEWLVTHPELRPGAVPVLRSLAYDNRVTSLPPAVVEAYLGTRLQTSISRLQRFAACPFQHFAEYFLRLREREELRLDPGRMGSLYHQVLRAWVERLVGSGRDPAGISDDEAVRWVDQLLDRGAGRLRRAGVQLTGREEYLLASARRILDLVVRILLEQLRAGAYRPDGLELGFGRPGDRLPPWVPEGAEDAGVEVVGVIDRVDTARIDGELYVRVLDYKSGMRDFHLRDVVYALDLQLPVYLAVAARAMNARPAGVFYIPIDEPWVDRGAELTPDDVWRALRKKMRARGMMLADDRVAEAMDREAGPGTESLLFPFGYTKDRQFRKDSAVVAPGDMEHLLRYVARRVSELAAAIRRGEHAARPFRFEDGERACDFCPYHAVCRFDVLIDGSEYQYLRSLSARELWAIIRGDAAGEEVNRDAGREG